MSYVCYYGVRDTEYREIFTGVAQRMTDGEMSIEEVLAFMDSCQTFVQPAYLLMSRIPLRFLFWTSYKSLRDEFFAMSAIRVGFIQWQFVNLRDDNKVPKYWFDQV